MMSDDKLQSELKRLSGEASFAHYLSLYRPQPLIFETIGLYGQLAATIDLHLRRIYFALLAEGKNKRGPERAHLDQIMERLPAAIENCVLDLYRKTEFQELLTVLRELLRVETTSSTQLAVGNRMVTYLFSLMRTRRLGGISKPVTKWLTGSFRRVTF